MKRRARRDGDDMGGGRLPCCHITTKLRSHDLGSAWAWISAHRNGTDGRFDAEVGGRHCLLRWLDPDRDPCCCQQYCLLLLRYFFLNLLLLLQHRNTDIIFVTLPPKKKKKGFSKDEGELSHVIYLQQVTELSGGVTEDFPA